MHRRVPSIFLLSAPIANKDSLMPLVYDRPQFFQIILRIPRMIGLTVWNGRCPARGVQSVFKSLLWPLNNLTRLTFLIDLGASGSVLTLTKDIRHLPSAT